MPQSSLKRRFARKTSALAIVLLAPLGACDANTPNTPTAPLEDVANTCGDGTSLQTSLFGAIETTVSWSGSNLECDSMPRPDGAGIRLQFVGEISGERLAFIIALPELEAGQQALETPANVTATVEGSGRFYTTPGLESCWTEIDAQDPIAGHEREFTLRATLICIAPLGEVNGDSAVSIPSLKFVTRARWGKQ